MEIYLLKFSACLLVFWLIYVLFLERQSMHFTKRIYLLGALVLAFSIPLMTITKYVEPVTRNIETLPSANIPYEAIDEQVAIQESFWNLEHILWIIYGLGVLVFAIRFILSIYKMYERISKNERLTKPPFIYVLLKERRIPHSFFKYLFFNEMAYKNQEIPKEVIIHEETHSKQWHSLDILIMELVQIVFWFHPLVYMLKHHIKLNHEFLADQAVISEVEDTKTYQNILLQFSSSTPSQRLSSAINYSSFKKRFTVMKTKTSKTKIWFSSLLILPIIAILFYSFAEREYVEKENSEISEAIAKELKEAEKQQVIYTDGATEAMMKEYNDWIIKFNTTHYIDYSKYERIVAIYDIMTEKQRASVEKYPVLPNTNLSKVKPKTPTYSQFETWKNENEFAIWIDGKHVSNSKLNDYKASDILHFVGSKVHKNARSGKFPQPFQYSLYTKQGFQKSYQESAVNAYKELTKTYSKAIQEYLKGPQTNNSELKTLYAQAKKLYDQFAEAELKKYNLLMPPPTPAQYEKPKNINQQNPPTRKEIKAYNVWAKAINQKMAKAKANNDVNVYPIIKSKEVKKYKTIYDRMTEAQKKNAEPWPNIPPPPPPAPEPPKPPKPPKPMKKGDNVPPPPPPPMPKDPQGNLSKGHVNAYNEWMRHIKRENSNPKLMTEEVYNAYRVLYNAMTEKQKKMTDGMPPPPPPPSPKSKNKKGPKQPKKIAVTGYQSQNKNLKEVTVTGYKSKTVEKKPMIYEMENGEIIEVVEVPDETQDQNINQVPPPPPPKSAYEFVKSLKDDDIIYYFEDKKVSYKEILKITKDNSNISIHSNIQNNKGYVKFWIEE